MRFYKFLVYISIVSILILSTFNYENYSYSKSIVQNNFYTMDRGYIYKLSPSGVEIIKINKFKNMKRESLIKEELLNGKIHIFKDKLFISGIKNNNSCLNIIVYDIYDKKNPIKLSEFTIDGNEYLLKERDGVLYLLSQGKNNKINIISVDLNSNKVSLKTNEFSSGDKINLMYLSNDSLYILCKDDTLHEKSTVLHKLHVNRDILTYMDKIYFDGTVLNESFINENGDLLRVLTIQEDNKNKMYIFNKELENVNSIDINSHGNNINTVYFDGNICYISSFMKNSYLSIYDLNVKEPKEVGGIKIESSIDHILKLRNGKLFIVGNETRFDTYKNLNSHAMYELLKNIGIKIMILDIKDMSNPIIFDEYLIRGRQVYSPILSDGNNFLYLEDKNTLVFPLDITNYNSDMDVNSAMEVGLNIYGNIISNYEKIFNGVYVFDIDDESGINLKFIINNQKEFKDFEYKDTEYINVVDNKIFIFTKDCIKVFDFVGSFLGEYSFNK